MDRKILLSFILVLFSITVFGQKEPQKRYNYNIRGRVLNENSRPAAKVNVCFYPTVRPIHGRIFCVKTDEKGTFSVGEKTVPDKYHVCASTSDSLIRTDKKTRFVCSKSMTFGERDESRKVILKLKPINQSIFKSN
jgi:hypothetical protein